MINQPIDQKKETEICNKKIKTLFTKLQQNIKRPKLSPFCLSLQPKPASGSLVGSGSGPAIVYRRRQ